MPINKALNLSIGYDSGMIKQADLRRFWSYVAKLENSCWIWTGALTQNYGCYSIGGRNQWIYAHRFSYWLHNGPIPKQLFVCHHCDNPSCVRPDHLFLGTAADNVMDSRNKLRHKARCKKREILDFEFEQAKQYMGIKFDTGMWDGR